jgi:hypothetical protein
MPFQRLKPIAKEAGCTLDPDLSRQAEAIVATVKWGN